MAELEGERNVGAVGGFATVLARHIGETVTIFTASGGESGTGFTGVILSVNACIVRLITRIGPPPACALGNACSDFKVGFGGPVGPAVGGCGAGNGFGGGFGGGFGPVIPANVPGAATAGGWDGFPVYTVGSVTDIPVDRIVSFVHTAV